ncbi:hypothetical protein niasHT_008108 [Heterodera trifolii]|uniref:Moesin/ezrin/radixin homolog 1 n=1 Tax=Heterodera trifolii TaxID=157864 RepID=A0ABD2M014_9BILA
MSSKSVNVKVVMMDAEFEFAIPPSTVGKQLFDQVIKTINLREIWYFGLQYTDSKGISSWLKLDKKVLKQDIKKEQTLQFKFRAKFYPEDVAEEIIQDVTLRLFYLQVKDLILTGEVYCPPDQAVLLGSYAMQAKYGDYSEEEHGSGCLANDRLIPQRVLKQFKLKMSEWESRVMNWWLGHKGMDRLEAMLGYLKYAQDLEQYGVNYFSIRNKKGSELFLGVDALGLTIYEKNDKLNPKVGFPWSEIRNISFNDKKFVIKTIDKKAEDFAFYSARFRINKTILELCIGNHEMYMKRRNPDSIEVQQLKEQAKEERTQRQLKISMKEEIESAQRELEVAQGRIRRLEDQIDELNEAKRLLEEKEHELQTLNTELASERAMSKEERSRLLTEIALQESRVSEKRFEVKNKTEEMNKLKAEVESGNGHLPTEFNDPDDLTNAPIEMSTFHEGDVNNVMPQRELDRTNFTDQDLSLKHKLELLTKELDNARDERAITEFDVLHMENKRQARDKYNTLRQIRSGNTKRRIDQFENM